MQDVQEFGVALSALLETRSDIRWIFPIAEVSVRLMLRLSELIPQNVQVAMVPQRQFLTCTDKHQSNMLANRAGIRYPESRVVSNLRELSAARDAIGCPVVVKSDKTVDRVFGRQAYIVRTEAEFNAVFQHWPVEHDTLMVQKYIVGVVVGCDFVARSGTLVAYCAGCSVRKDMLDGTGYGVEFLTKAPSEDLVADTKAFVRTHDYSGPGIIQFVREEATGKLFFLENNPRLSAGVADSIGAGIDLPVLALQSLDTKLDLTLEEFSAEGKPYKIGWYTHWLSRDIEGYVNQRQELSRVERRNWLWNIFRSFRRANGDVMWQWKDPLPGIWIYLRLGVRVVWRLILPKPHERGAVSIRQ